VARPILTDLSLARRAGHIKTANGTEIHTNTTINTGLLIDLKTIGHANLLQGNISVFLAEVVGLSNKLQK
jgi:hypothetical protein